MLDVTFVFSKYHVNKFGVKITYDVKVCEFFKTIIGRKYDAEEKIWYFPIKQYRYVKTGLENMNVLISKEPDQDELAVTVVFVPHADKTVHLNFPFNAEVNQILKANGAKYHIEEKIWVIGEKVDIDQLKLELEMAGIKSIWDNDIPKSM
jgi:hypothetical protein